MIESLKGFRDYYPENWYIIKEIINKSEVMSKRFGFEEYDAPILESAELWLKKSGGEIPDQMYVFKDKNAEQIALRPEMTPSLARMIAQKHKELKKPIKWFSFPRCFRYEQPQKGRFREFFQYNADIIGEKTPMVHADLIALSIEILKSFGLTDKDVYVRLGNRQIIDSIFRLFNIKNTKEVLQIIDKKDKISRVEFEKMCFGAGIKKVNEFIRTIESDIMNLPELDSEGENAKQFTKSILGLLTKSNYKKYMCFDLTIVRGLDYYTDSVFEVFDKQGKFRAIAGGGSYSNLISEFDASAKLDAIGFGMGDAVLTLLLQDRGLIKPYKHNIDYFIATIGNVNETAFDLANKLRKHFNVEVNYSEKGLSKQLDYANYLGAKKAIILGERDLATGYITIKDLIKGNDIKKKLILFVKSINKKGI